MFNLDDFLYRDIISTEEETQLNQNIPDITRKYSRKILRYGVSKYNNNLVSLEVPQYLLELADKLTKSGILKFFDIAYHMNAFTRIEFEVEDIVRSSLVRDYIMAKIKHEDLIKE